MNKIETIWRVLVTSLAVWRLSQLLFGNIGETGRSQSAEDPQRNLGAGSFWANRATDFACWISVWMSSQTAMWTVCGFAGVFLVGLMMAGASRLFLGVSGESEVPALELLSVEGRGGVNPGLSCGDMLQAHHG